MGASVLIFAVLVAVAAWLIVTPVYRYFHPADYSGAGTGTTVVTIHTDDGATQIGQRLYDSGVVASAKAFVNSASDNAASAGIQPGSYRLHRRMSAKAALTLLLDPKSKINSSLLVPEGATERDVARRLSAPRCTSGSSSTTVCGAGLPASQVSAALRDLRALGLPSDYTVGSKSPSSAEGFLYPATYSFADRVSASDALQQMVAAFAEQARSIGFTAAARAQRITPYQELIIASIAQGEAKYAQDYPKVARVILNRLAARKPLQIDATSAYAAKLAGLDPAKIIYAKIKSPYNTYTHDGLPPTPIGNPGSEAMQGVSTPPAGNWLYYVNADAAGHLFFTNSATAFARAAALCHARHWGCG